MRIGYLISQYPAVSHTFIMREVLGLRQLGWSVSTMSIRPAAQRELLTDADRAEAAGTQVIVTRNPLRILGAVFASLAFAPGRFFKTCHTAIHLRRPGLKGLFWALFYFIEAMLVYRNCRRNRITHLHAHFANVACDVAHLASILNGGAFSFTMHGPTEFFDQHEHRLAEKAAAARCIICISDFARSQMMALLPPEQWSKLHVVHCAVDVATALHKSHDENTSAPRELLCVARLAPVKGHAILLQAISLLLMRGNWVKLTLIGDGPMRAALERQADVLGISDQVSFPGNVGQHEIAEHYARADLFVLPSFAEGVPVVLMEALAARCPVVATRIAGIAELVEPGVSGTLVAPGRADLLAVAIEQLLNNPHLARRMAGAGHEKVRREFNLRQTIPQLAAIFEQHVFGKPVVRPAVEPQRRGLDVATGSDSGERDVATMPTRASAPLAAANDGGHRGDAA